MAIFGLVTKKNKKQEREKPFDREERVPFSQKEEKHFPSYIVVVGDGRRFSKDLMHYSVEMAKRLHYSIIALNAIPIGEELPVRGMERRRLIEKFEGECREEAIPFQKLASEHGIGFLHIVKFTEKEIALEELKREHPEIEFVISDSEKECVIEEGSNMKKICVYSVA